MTKRGWYLRSEDSGALARYHKWAANHVSLPTPALHSQTVTVCGPFAKRGGAAYATASPGSGFRSWKRSLIELTKIIRGRDHFNGCPNRCGQSFSAKPCS
jgi:hypothetical protein